MTCGALASRRLSGNAVLKIKITVDKFIDRSPKDIGDFRLVRSTFCCRTSLRP